MKRHYFLLLALFPILITSLWENNIYILFVFSVLCWFILPFKKFWDSISIPLFVFSLFYVLVLVLNGEISSWFFVISMLFSPVAFYRLGCFLINNITDDKNRQKILLFIIASYLTPLFILTILDIELAGLINDSRKMMVNINEDDGLSATLYGLMSSVGIGCVGTVFTKKQNLWVKLVYLVIMIFSLLSVIHLINRTGLVIWIACIFCGIILLTRMKLTKMLPIILISLTVFVLILNFGLIDAEIIEAYNNREDSIDSDAVSAGGRTDIWIDALGKLFVSPFGWKLERYSHNLWLDIARVGGWLALFPFLKISFVYFKKIRFLIKHYKNSDFLFILLSVNFAMLLNSSVEPVIDGSLLFFLLLMLIWGMTVNFKVNT